MDKNKKTLAKIARASNRRTQDGFKYLNLLVGFLLLGAILIGGNLQRPVSAYELSIGDKIRLDRLNTCEEAYKEAEIGEQFLFGQIPAVRCATYSTLIYAFESNYGKSQKCVNQKNCHGMKGNGRDHPAGFITFNSYREGREWFANRYFRWHYKKNVDTFVRNWSMTDQDIYVKFVEERYWKVYSELETLYINN